MARNHPVQRLSLANLVFLAGTASGTFLTLSNFQGLASSVPVQCLYAYNLPIRGCSPTDFLGGATCSESCIAGLQAVQFTVRGLCANVNTASNTLLGQIQAGNILGVLCRTDKPQISTTSTPISHPTQTPPPPQASSELQSTTNGAPHLISTSSAPPEATTSVIPSAPPEATTSVITSATTEASFTSVVIPSSISEPTSEATNTPTSQATDSEQASSSSKEQPKPTRQPNSQPGSGGGSPFDFVDISAATKFRLSGGSVAMVIVIAFTTLTLI